MFTFNCKGRLLTIDNPIVMGIINLAPDSFFGGSIAATTDDALRLADKMLTEGATMLDIGGQTTKPGSEAISIKEEISRVVPVIEAVAKKFPEAFISIDTYNAETAKEAVNAGAVIVNDIGAGTLDTTMIETVAGLEVPYIAMHIKGTPATMQQLNSYDDMLLEILEFFIEKTNECQRAGIKDIILDPGFGFAKNSTQNFTLLKNMGIFKILQRPLLAGLSRKSSVSKTLDVSAGDALNGTTVLNTIALQNGANILRVHDVKEAVEAIKLVQIYRSV